MIDNSPFISNAGCVPSRGKGKMGVDPSRAGGGNLETADILIVGGGVIGSAAAYFIAAHPGFSGRVTVVERDLSFKRCSTSLSVGGFRKQFSTPENIEIAQFSAQFIASITTYLSFDGEALDVGFVEGGYLFLATPDGAPILRENTALQHSLGVDTRLMETDELKTRFPWLNTAGLYGGSLGEKQEGWLDPYSLMRAFQGKAKSLGVTYLEDEVTGMAVRKGRVTRVALAGAGSINCGMVVNAAGTGARNLARLAGIDIPVFPRKRCVFPFECRGSFPGFPMIIDPTGVYVRPEGNGFLCGVAPPPEQDGNSTDLRVDNALFEDIIWPVLGHRIPAFETLKPGRPWAGHYAYNISDQNAIVGIHGQVDNFIFANGFSGHGLQQSPAVGRAVGELVVDGGFQTIDLSRFSPERFERDECVWERNVI